MHYLPAAAHLEVHQLAARQQARAPQQAVAKAWATPSLGLVWGQMIQPFARCYGGHGARNEHRSPVRLKVLSASSERTPVCSLHWRLVYSAHFSKRLRGHQLELHAGRSCTCHLYRRAAQIPNLRHQERGRNRNLDFLDLSAFAPVAASSEVASTLPYASKQI